MELAGGFEGDAVDEAEGALASDGGLRVVADDIEGDLTETFAAEEVGQGDGLDLMVSETVLLDAAGEVGELVGAGAELLCRVLCGAHDADGTPGQ